VDRGRRPPSGEQRRLYALAHEEIERNVALFRPGASFREIAEKAWRLPDPYRDSALPGLAHGIGLVNEYPLILHQRHFESDGYDGLVEADMIICVESYVGQPGGAEGVKLEQQIRVTTGSGALVPLPAGDAAAVAEVRILALPARPQSRSSRPAGDRSWPFLGPTNSAFRDDV
jgi:Xaa-Pro aminopeptidase